MLTCPVGRWFLNVVPTYLLIVRAHVTGKGTCNMDSDKKVFSITNDHDCDGSKAVRRSYIILCPATCSRTMAAGIRPNGGNEILWCRRRNGGSKEHTVPAGY